jgi:stage V sporulation protein D (sporulation-specific penicillin-binding protein)
MDDPQYIVLVALDTPSRSTGLYISGGVMAAPTVGAVMADILPYLGVANYYEENDPAGKTVTLPDLVGMTQTEAKKVLKDLGLIAQIQGSGSVVTGQIPGKNTLIKGNSEVILYFIE